MDKRYERRLNEDYDNRDENNEQNLKLISLKLGSNGLGIRLSKSSWDPFPFVSHVNDKTEAQERGIQAGDCVLKVKIGNIFVARRRIFGREESCKKNSETKTK